MSARRKGRDLTGEAVDRIVGQLVANGIETVNLGGNEPIYTNGLSVRDSLLPYIIQGLHARGILVGLTTSGITLKMLARYYPESASFLNDVDVSFDSPFEDEHNANRGAKVYRDAVQALGICEEFGVERSLIMCAMDWNFTIPHLRALLELARAHEANVRINPLKTVESGHMKMHLSARQYYEGFAFLMGECDILDLGEPPLAALCGHDGAKGCPCGRSSFRIHSITPDGEVPVSPCVYLHDFKAGDLLVDDLAEIVRGPQFATFRRRNRNPEQIDGCDGCELIASCRGGCGARSYLEGIHRGEGKSMFRKDPYCPKEYQGLYPVPRSPALLNIRLVHQDYLCTWIGRPR
jgi:radical SAM protein with 4Fe4S-binding SPASM domain